MLTIRSRRDLSLLIEKQMTAASTRGASPTIDEDIEGRTALKTYLLEAHDRMRAEPLAAMTSLGRDLGITVEPTQDPELIALTWGELQLWLDTSDRRVCRLYTVGVAKDADRVHLSLVSGSGLLECVWLPPETLERLAHSAAAKMVLFSLRHDRRPLRRAPDEHGVDSVTLRFWGPRARDTLHSLRHSDVLPDATSVYSVRVRLGDEARYCLAEVFHNGKLTAVGSSFQEHETIVRFLVDEHLAQAEVIARAQSEGRRIMVPVPWTTDDLGYAVARMFSGAEPFRLWGIPEREGDPAQGTEVYRTRAVDLDVGRTARFVLDRRGASLEMSPRTPPSTAIRFAAALQYHVSSRVKFDPGDEPLLARAMPPAAESPAFRETDSLALVARAVLPEVCALWVRGSTQFSTGSILETTHGHELGTEALHNLTRKVLDEATAQELRQWLRRVVSPEGRVAWRFADPLPVDATARLRELVRFNRAAQQLVARMGGTGLARWLQLSLFGAAEMVAAITDAVDD
jgi:hypothetical protein